MQDNSQPPIEIAALRPKETRFANPLTPGTGTPWEDRGSLGLIVAFFKTVFMAMFVPQKLLGQIRRPETVSDSRSFVMILSFFWGAGWLIWDILKFTGTKDAEFDIALHGRNWAIHFALGMGGSWLLFNAINKFFHSMISSGSANVPPTLTFNVLAYSAAPSLLGVIPNAFAWAAAAVWITILIMVGAASRMASKLANAVVCALMAMGLFVGGSVGLYFLARVVFRWLQIDVLE